MNYNEYKDRVTDNYNNLLSAEIGDYKTDVMYDEKFECKWFATKFKMFSFINYSNHVSKEIIEAYSKICFEYSRKNYKGVPRGLQNGFVSFSVIASENIEEDAIRFAQARPSKHFSAFEMPIIYDLNKKSLYYYVDTPMWGRIYYKYFREYIERNFK